MIDTKYQYQRLRGNLWDTSLTLKYTLRFLIAMWQDKGRPSLSYGRTADGRIFVQLKLEEHMWKSDYRSK